MWTIWVHNAWMRCLLWRNVRMIKETTRFWKGQQHDLQIMVSNLPKVMVPKYGTYSQHHIKWVCHLIHTKHDQNLVWTNLQMQCLLFVYNLTSLSYPYIMILQIATACCVKLVLWINMKYYAWLWFLFSTLVACVSAQLMLFVQNRHKIKFILSYLTLWS